MADIGVRIIRGKSNEGKSGEDSSASFLPSRSPATINVESVLSPLISIRRSTVWDRGFQMTDVYHSTLPVCDGCDMNGVRCYRNLDATFDAHRGT